MRWTHSLAEDVRAARERDSVVLETAIGRTRLTGADADAAVALARRPGGSDRQAAEVGAAMLYRLDRAGLLARTLHAEDGPLLACEPLRPAPGPPPVSPPEGVLRLSAHAAARPVSGRIVLETPGAAARVVVHDPRLLALFAKLAAGATADECVAALPDIDADAVLAALAVMGWCGLFEGPADAAWAVHDLLAHVRTRLGYARTSLGKTGAEAAPAERRIPRHDDIQLPRPDLERMSAEDPPLASAFAQRRSLRRQGAAPITLDQLSEFAFRTFGVRDARRSYPSGGGLHPLRCYLAVHRCLGLAPGLYAYDEGRHSLAMVAESGAGLNELLDDAASAAGAVERPQVLVLLAARFASPARVYGDLAYGLILKETGAAMQTAMLAATAMGLATCPLGAGNSIAFSALARLDPLAETSVGELMLGSRPG